MPTVSVASERIAKQRRLLPDPHKSSGRGRRTLQAGDCAVVRRFRRNRRVGDNPPLERTGPEWYIETREPVVDRPLNVGSLCRGATDCEICDGNHRRLVRRLGRLFRRLVFRSQPCQWPRRGDRGGRTRTRDFLIACGRVLILPRFTLTPLTTAYRPPHSQLCNGPASRQAF